MRSALAPIAVFAHRRPNHLAQCLRALASNPEAEGSRLYIFCDGPRDISEKDITQQVENVARRAAGFLDVEVVRRPKNFGLSRNVISGINEVLSESDTIVVVEEDLVVSTSFLAFMNEGLVMYADNSNVAAIHGFTYTMNHDLPQSFFMRGADCWGWATWRRSWNHFNPSADDLIEQLESANLTDAFDLEGAFPYVQMLKDQRNGKVDSWAVRWHASAFLAEMFTLYPGRSLVANLGLEGSGTHAGSFGALVATTGDFLSPLKRIDIAESVEARRALIRAMRRRDGKISALRTWFGGWFVK